MGRRRTIDDLVIDRGSHLQVEWYWRVDGTMPGRDDYEGLARDEREDFLAAVAHWLKRKPGERPHRSVVNQEHEKPLILVIKAGKRRFPVFEGIPGSSWIVLASYEKEGEKRDKVGDRAIERAVKARGDYYERVKGKKYYP